MPDVVLSAACGERPTRAQHGLPTQRDNHPKPATLCSGDGQGVALSIDHP